MAHPKRKISKLEETKEELTTKASTHEYANHTGEAHQH